jgi:hypothetical protein
VENRRFSVGRTRTLGVFLAAAVTAAMAAAQETFQEDLIKHVGRPPDDDAARAFEPRILYP